MVTTPVFEHLFNIGQGLKSFDTSGNHRHSVLSGNPAWVNGRKGKAIALDGVDDAFVAPVTENVNEDFTVAFWVQNWVPGSGGAGLGILALQTASDIHATNNSLIIYKDISTGEIKVACYDTDAMLDGTLESGSTASSGFMCVRKSGLTVSFFLNGVFVDEIDVTELNNFDWVLVGLTAYNYTKADWIDKIRYWDSALSDEEIEYWYAKDKPRWNDSCVLWLRGDEENGVAVKDYSPQGNDGALTASISNGAIDGCSWIVDAEKGKCLSWDGVDDRLLIDNQTSYEFGTGDFSMSCSVKYTTHAGAEDIVFSCDDESASPRRLYNITVDSAGNLKFGIYDSGTSKYAIAGDYGDGEWHDVVGVRDGDNLYIYVDGVLVDTETGASALVATVDVAGHISFGCYEASLSNDYLDGIIKDARLYNRALSSTEIAALYNRTAEVSYGCVGKWLLNEGSGTTAYDSHNRFTAVKGNGLNFGGGSGICNVANSDSLKLANEITLILNFKGHSLPVVDLFVVEKLNSYRMYWRWTKNPVFVIYGSTSTFSFQPSYSAGDLGVWLQFACSFANRKVVVTRNGEIIHSDDAFDLGGIVQNNNALTVGGRSYGANCEAMLDEIIIFSRGLSPTELKRVYEADGFLDYIPLCIQDGSLVVSVDSVGVQWDSWAGGACRRKHLGLGKNVAYTFTAIEEVSDVAWIDSAAYILKEKMEAGTPVDFYIKKTDVLAAESTSVVIDSMNVRYSPTMQVRYIDFSVREQ